MLNVTDLVKSHIYSSSAYPNNGFIIKRENLPTSQSATTIFDPTTCTGSAEFDTTFYGKMFNVPIDLPTLDALGQVEYPAIYTESINLKSGVVRWLTSENEMYITTQINLLASDSQSSGITLRTIDQMDIYAMLTFVMDTEQLSHRENINQKTENYKKEILK